MSNRTRGIGFLIGALCFLAALIFLVVLGRGSQDALGWLIFGAAFLFCSFFSWYYMRQAKRE